MSKKPEISVVMSVYKETVPVLKMSIESILKQTFSDFEFIIVLDDPDNRAACEFLDTLEDIRIKIIRNNFNLGISKSSNIGIKAAVGRYIARHDADDISYKNRLKLQHEFMQQDQSADVLGTALVYVDFSSGKELFVRKYEPVVGDELKRVCGIAHATVLVKRELYELYGYYDESGEFSCADEYELWLRWYSNGVVFKNIDDVLYSYFQYATNNKRVNTRRQLVATIRAKLKYRAKLNFSFIENLYMYMEIILSKLPGIIIINLFYFVQKLKNRK